MEEVELAERLATLSDFRNPFQESPQRDVRGAEPPLFGPDVHRRSQGNAGRERRAVARAGRSAPEETLRSKEE
jgi:hypothetical protein